MRADVRSWDKFSIWDDRAAMYAHLTQRHAWCVAALVGPGPDIRVFCQGRLVAHKDGKGWQRLRDPVSALKDAVGRWPTKTKALNENRLRKLFEIAVQLSPRLRPESHGGLLVHHMSSKVIDKFAEALPLNELQRMDKNFWLTGAKLFNPGSDELNYNVANLIVRSSAIDGAICLAGEDCEAVSYTHLTLPTKA